MFKLKWENEVQVSLGNSVSGYGKGFMKYRSIKTADSTKVDKKTERKKALGVSCYIYIYTHMHNLVASITLSMSLDCEGKPKYLEETPQ